jgi:hypothetical protein
LRFGEVLTAAISLFVVSVVFSYLLEMVLIPAFGFSWGPTLGALTSVLIGALLVGFLFARRMAERRNESLVVVSVFFTALMVFAVVANSAALGSDFTDWVHESYQAANPQASLSAFEWFVVGGLYLGAQMFINVVTLFPLSLAGLYAGSTLRRHEAS